MYILRPYQQDAINAVRAHLMTRTDNPCVVIPTAGGKTAIIAAICSDYVEVWGCRVLILAHVKELLEQTAATLARFAPKVKFGLYSAGLGKREVDKPAIIASIQSVYNKADALGAFDLVIIDEAHRMAPLDETTMYWRLIGDLKRTTPELRVVGLTATPYRLSCGPICTPNGVLNTICYEISVKSLIDMGYLCPLITKAGIAEADLTGLRVRAGEFVQEDVDKAMDQTSLVHKACEEIAALTASRNRVLVFACGVEHGIHVRDTLARITGQEVGFVCGETPAEERDRLISAFRSEALMPLKYLVNVDVLSTGFDAPNIDCVAVLRPTMSPGWWVQAVGRGLRKHESKKDCLVLDYGGNAERHGPVDAIVPPTAPGAHARDQEEDDELKGRKCPQCRTVTRDATCPDCGYEFPVIRRLAKHSAEASIAPLIDAPGSSIVKKHKVYKIVYSLHIKRDAPPGAPKTMRVDYITCPWNLSRVSEWICFEHDGYPRLKAARWWFMFSKNSMPTPRSSAEAVDIARLGGLKTVSSITVKQVPGNKFPEIIDYEIGPLAVAGGQPITEEHAIDF
jgi:DNA repair protein RadD